MPEILIMNQRRKIGILGGTFDPIHNAHLSLGHQALEQFRLDQVLFMPTGISYFKMNQKQMTDAVHRAAMVKLAIQDEPRFAFSDIEIRREGETYTADTLQELCREHPDVEYHFILGADSLRDMERWYHPQVIFDSAVILVANRNHQVPEKDLKREIDQLSRRFGARIRLLPIQSMPVSSTMIREQIHQQDASALVPASVLAYIRAHGLYGRHLLEEQEEMEEKKS